MGHGWVTVFLCVSNEFLFGEKADDHSLILGRIFFNIIQRWYR